MIAFYQDAALKNPVSTATPKRMLLPLSGGSKTGSLYLGDSYVAAVRASAAIGTSELLLDQVAEFPVSGSAVILFPAAGLIPASQMTVNYTGAGAGKLVGVSGVTSIVPAGSVIRPNTVWRTRGNVVLLATGSDVPNNVLVSFGVPVAPDALSRTTVFGVAGAAYISTAATIATGVENALRFDLTVQVAPGTAAEFTQWSVAAGSFYLYQAGDNSTIPGNASGVSPAAPGYILRLDQAISLSARLLPASRRVSSTVPGFRIGDYRWRDQAGRDATAVVPTRWDADLNAIGINNFTTGIGASGDLAPQYLEEGAGDALNSIFLRIKDGNYFDGPVRYFLPGASNTEFWSGEVLTHTLSVLPASQKPVFVGTWKLDSDGFYSVASNYRYTTAPAFIADGSLQFQLDRRARVVKLSQGLVQQTLFMGMLGGKGTDRFSLPVHPVYSIEHMYIALGTNLGTADLNSFVFDSDNGMVTVTSTPGSLYAQGQPVYAVCNPAIAVQYEVSSVPDAGTRLLPVDLNPAFSGVTKGFVYLQHRQLAPVSIVLACDKPLIAIPATHQSIIGLVAYGPVYFNGDYALLSATARGSLNGEVVPDVAMKVVVDPGTWSGLINYKDPTVEDVTVTTGADGVVNMIYTPKSDWGLYVPTLPASGNLAGIGTTTIAGDTMVLPEPLPISQLRRNNAWMVTLYTVANNNPVYGMVGANTSLGQVPWTATGTPGTLEYKTNGQLVANALVPVKALDADGNDQDSSLFTGQVVSLVYPQAIPASAVIGSYFLTFVQRVRINLQVIDSGLLSNTILVQMADPPLIVENAWLILNSAIQGIIGQFRLGQAVS